MCSKRIPQIGGGECDSMLTVPLRGKNPAADSILPTNFIPLYQTLSSSKRVKFLNVILLEEHIEWV